MVGWEASFFLHVCGDGYANVSMASGGWVGSFWFVSLEHKVIWVFFEQVMNTKETPLPFLLHPTPTSSLSTKHSLWKRNTLAGRGKARRPSKRK
mmetsp:Transcript_40480/g.104938  ORF Transcript_40480/g.104938 Transcript_40480/m.104938 type:complete len:94 (-) Transcript_40480:790-1071(-)